MALCAVCNSGFNSTEHSKLELGKHVETYQYIRFIPVKDGKLQRASDKDTFICLSHDVSEWPTSLPVPAKLRWNPEQLLPLNGVAEDLDQAKFWVDTLREIYGQFIARYGNLPKRRKSPTPIQAKEDDIKIREWCIAAMYLFKDFLSTDDCIRLFAGTKGAAIIKA